MNDEAELKTAQPQKQKVAKLSAEKALPASGVEALIKIIKGYVVASQGGESQTNYRDVASATTLSPTLVSGNNTFLAESAIITSPKYGYYLPSEEAVRYAREAAWDEEKAKSHLRKLVSRCWYGQVAIQNFTLRSTLTRDEFKRSLAIKCGATEGDSNALERLIDFIIYTGLVTENEQGLLTKGNLDEVPGATEMQPESERHDQSKASPPALQVATAPTNAATVTLVLHVHVKNLSDLTDENAEAVKRWAAKLGCGTIQLDGNLE
jgi:hypothetical protein